MYRIIFAAFLVHTCTAIFTGDALRVCRELDYNYVVNSTVAASLMVNSGDPQRLDYQLLLKLNNLISDIGTTQSCAFNWKQLMCSHVFRFPNADAAACPELCSSTTASCYGPRPVQCAEAGKTCTNYYTKTHTGAAQCHSRVQTAPSPPFAAPAPGRGGGGGGGGGGVRNFVPASAQSNDRFWTKIIIITCLVLWLCV